MSLRFSAQCILVNLPSERLEEADAKGRAARRTDKGWQRRRGQSDTPFTNRGGFLHAYASIRRESKYRQHPARCHPRSRACWRVRPSPSPDRPTLFPHRCRLRLLPPLHSQFPKQRQTQHHIKEATTRCQPTLACVPTPCKEVLESCR